MVTTATSQGETSVKVRHRLLIEDWLPIEELGIESQRERGASSALPPLYFLHVWWARRPLTVSRAAVLGSLLPKDFPHADFRRLMGIVGDPVSDRRRIDAANLAGVKLKQGYSSKRAFTNPIPQQQLMEMRSAISRTWKLERPTVVDPFAGGGSIPFEIMRLGLDFVANELNPVASIIERATIEFPAKYGDSLHHEIKRWADKVSEELGRELSDCFPKRPGEEVFAYVWVRTVRCHECGLVVPLTPNWWLDTEGRIGFQPLLPPKGENYCTFKIVTTKKGGFDPEKGSIADGIGQCPRPGCRSPLDTKYIKGEAQSGRMGHQLAAVGYKIRGQKGRHFREATDTDVEGVLRAERLLKEKLPVWQAKNLVPEEEIPEGSKTTELRRSGILRWCDAFSQRQLLVHLFTSEKIKSLPIEASLDASTAAAVRTYLALAFDKTVDYNSLQSRLDVTRVAIKNTFDRHDYAFIWSYGEFDGSGQLWRWAENQVLDAYEGLVALLRTGTKQAGGDYICGDASSIPSIPSNSIACVVTDPPYSYNVMYAELSDYFYVWMKRILGDVYPDLFVANLTDKDSEAVANRARFRDFKGKAAELAQNDYEAKMTTAFKEAHRILQENGVLTVMFTHKSDDAWDALGRGLINAGFEITASWPVHSESRYSLHQARQVAAGSTILLVCRKRVTEPGTRGWWEDIRPLVRDVAYSKAKDHYSQGIRGVDLMLSTYGPALKELSSRWPVMDRSGAEIRPREALEEASRAASDFRMSMLTERLNLTMDMPTRFYIHAWDYYQAEEIPADDAIKLSHTLNVDLTDLESRYGLVKKKGSSIILQGAARRVKSGKLSLGEDASYRIALDKVHSTELAYDEKGVAGVRRIYESEGFLSNPDYVSTVEALLNSLPPGSEEYETLRSITQYAMQGRVRDRRSTQSSTPTGLDQFSDKSDSTSSQSDDSV